MKRKDALWVMQMCRDRDARSEAEREAFDTAIEVLKSESIFTVDRPRDEEDQLKFYYVESIDDYWIGMEIDNFYYADWHEGLGFVWSKSRYLPWGEHIVDENTLWKEHTYPSEPIVISFTKWIVGFVKKYFADRPRGEWIDEDGTYYANCSKCGYQMDTHQERGYFRYCPNCGARMGSD